MWAHVFHFTTDESNGNLEVRRDGGSPGRHQSSSKIWIPDRCVTLSMTRVPWILRSDVGIQDLDLPRDNLDFTFPSPLDLFPVFQIQAWRLFVCTYSGTLAFQGNGCQQLLHSPLRTGPGLCMHRGSICRRAEMSVEFQLPALLCISLSCGVLDFRQPN